MAPVSIHIRQYRPTAAGTPELHSHDSDLPHELRSYTHTVSAFGGEVSATAQLSVTRNGAVAWLDTVGAAVRVYDDTATRVFDGVLETVQLTDGARTISRTTAGLANHILVAYTKNGKASITSAATNAASVARYFRRTLVFSAGELTQTQAEATRDQLASALAWPSESTTNSLSTQPPRAGEVSVTLLVRGWGVAYEWTAYNLQPKSASSSLYTSNALINFILVESVDSPSSFGNNVGAPYRGAGMSFTGPTVLSGTGPTLPAPATREYETTLAVLRRLVEMGDASGNRLAWGVNLQRTRFDTNEGSGGPTLYFDANVWAGDTPSTIDYYLVPPGDLLNSGFGRVVWAQTRPDTMVAVLGGHVVPPRTASTIDDANRYYAAEVIYGWEVGRGETLEIRPEGDVDVATILARVR